MCHHTWPTSEHIPIPSLELHNIRERVSVGVEPPRANFSISAGATQTADAQRFLLVLDNSAKPSDRQKPQTPPAQISTQNTYSVSEERQTWNTLHWRAENHGGAVNFPRRRILQLEQRHARFTSARQPLIFPPGSCTELAGGWKPDLRLFSSPHRCYILFQDWETTRDGECHWETERERIRYFCCSEKIISKEFHNWNWDGWGQGGHADFLARFFLSKGVVSLHQKQCQDHQESPISWTRSSDTGITPKLPVILKDR